MKLVSACLLGVNCRYDGSSKPNDKIIELYKKGDLIPVCPEQLGGLLLPREPSEITKEGKYVLSGEAKAITRDGRDVSDYFIRGAKKTLNLAVILDVKEAILKSKSPSCGCGKIYDGTFSNKLIDGDGVTTALLKQYGINVITEEDFN